MGEHGPDVREDKALGRGRGMFVCMYVCVKKHAELLLCMIHTFIHCIILFRCALETWVMFAELLQFEKRRRNARMTWYVRTYVCMYVTMLMYGI